VTLIASLLGSKLGRYGAIALLMIASVGFMILKAFLVGQAREKAEQNERALKNLRTRINVEDDISKLDPVTRRERLREWTSE